MSLHRRCIGPTDLRGHEVSKVVYDGPREMNVELKAKAIVIAGPNSERGSARWRGMQSTSILERVLLLSSTGFRNAPVRH